MEGWIKIWRKFLIWEWYDDIPVRLLFIHLLLTANFESKKWRGVQIKRGQVVTSLAKLAKSTGLSVKATRIALDKLKSTHEVASKGANNSTIITICNYDTYQEYETMQGQAKGQAKGQGKGKVGASGGASKRATTKEGKKERRKEGKNINPPPLYFVSPNFLPVWEKWLTYRKEIKKPYRTETGMITKYNELINLSGDNPTKALLIVDQSIGNEWTGLFALKTNGSRAVVPGEDPVDRMIREQKEYFQKNPVNGT